LSLYLVIRLTVKKITATPENIKRPSLLGTEVKKGSTMEAIAIIEARMLNKSLIHFTLLKSAMARYIRISRKRDDAAGWNKLEVRLKIPIKGKIERIITKSEHKEKNVNISVRLRLKWNFFPMLKKKKNKPNINKTVPAKKPI